MANPASTVIVLGGGTAGFLVAIAVPRRLPMLHVRLIRSRDIGIIGVGEGTTVGVVNHLHSKFVLGLVDTPFWRAIWSDINLYAAEDLIDYYKECWPDQSLAQTLMDNHDQFGLGSYLVMLLGQNVPYNNRHQATSAERLRMEQWRSQQQAIAATGYTAEQALSLIRKNRPELDPGFLQWMKATSPSLL